MAYIFVVAAIQKVVVYYRNPTGRMIRTDKRGAIPINLPPILERLSINRQQWLKQSQQFEKLYATQFAKKQRTLKKTA
ncbi:MAG: hypothetical protein ACI9JR_001421 [Gammaproteobacteria bacterium]